MPRYFLTRLKVEGLLKFEVQHPEPPRVYRRLVSLSYEAFGILSSAT